MAKREHQARWYRPDGTVVQHGTHHHFAHRLTCEQFDALLARAGETCEICGVRDVKLYVDHVHTDLAYGPVRGLLCPKCNSHMRYIDAGTRPLDDATARYLAYPITEGDS